jgi:glycosyltransferase involved in cell wall biosynthesis
MPKFSLIIPIYNVEKYLAECLDSCIKQTFTDIEIICINDFSPDKCQLILDKYAKLDSRIKIVNHADNKGLGAARNTGIINASGDYCWFIDSDDYIILNACEILNDVLQVNKFDIIRFNRIDYSYDNLNEKKEILPQNLYSWAPANGVFNKVISKKEHYRLKMPETSTCMYITTTKLLKTLKFREGVINEDDDYTPILFSKANSIYYVNYSLYCVRRRIGSITRNIHNDGKLIIGTLQAADNLYNYIISEKLKKCHFCIRVMIFLYSKAKKEYYKFSELHTNELNKKLKRMKTFYFFSFIYIKLHDIILFFIVNNLLFNIINKTKQIINRKKKNS